MRECYRREIGARSARDRRRSAHFSPDGRGDAAESTAPAGGTPPTPPSPLTSRPSPQVTIGNLEAGRGAWDAVQDRSSTARFDYDEWRRRAAAAGAARAAASARDEL